MTTCYGKCILAGEHSVIIGNSAVITPVKSHYLTLSYNESDAPLTGTIEDENNGKRELNIHSILGNLIPDSSFLTGHFHIKLAITLSAGLGGSATISVALARWLAWKNMIASDGILQCAHTLENFFHGTSSGADVAAVFYEKPLIYKLGIDPQFINFTWKPNLYLSFSGVTSNTLEAVKHVMAKRKDLPQASSNLDRLMAEAVDNVISGVAIANNINQLTYGIQLAHRCFMDWDLVPDFLSQQCEFLLQQGALAVKPTGAGMGGFILSLWPDSPPSDLGIKFFPVLETSQ